MAKPHHAKRAFCATRAAYREGRELKAVKVYTVNQESRFLLVVGVPAVCAHDDLLKMFALYGAIEEYCTLDEYPAEEFTEVMWVKFKKIQAARIAKRKMDNESFYGGVLHVCYAPEYESVQDTREKLQDRRKTVAARIRKLETSEGKRVTPNPSAGNLASSEEWAYRTQQSGKHLQSHQLQQHCTAQQAPPQQPSTHSVPSPQHYAQHSTTQQPYPQPHSHTEHAPSLQQPQLRLEQHEYKAVYPPLPPPPLDLGVHGFPIKSTLVTHPSHLSDDLPNVTKGSLSEKLVIRSYQHKTVPNFVPRQLKGSGKPGINKSLLAKALERRTCDSVADEERSGAINKVSVKAIVKDKINDALKMESFVLGNIHGPMLAETKEDRPISFKITESGSESVAQTVIAIRKRVQEFSSLAPPPQLKRKRKT